MIKQIRTQNIIPKINWKDKTLMLLLVLASANPYIRQHLEYVVIIGLILILILKPSAFSPRHNSKLNPFLIIAFFISFEIWHRFIFGMDNLTTIVRVLGYFLLTLFTVTAIGKKYLNTYIVVIYTLSIISLIMYGLVYFGPGMDNLYRFAEKTFPLIQVKNPTLIFYTFDHAYFERSYPIIRNAGFAWEAGAFAAFVNLALFIRIESNKLTISKILRDRISLIFILSVLSTASTSGYIAMFVILLFISFSEKSSWKFLFSVIVSSIIIISFMNIEFLGEKTMGQLEEAQYSQNRFGSAILDWNDIKKRPLTGWSRDEEVLFKGDAFTYVTHRPNGITNLLRLYGFLYFIPMMLIMFYSLRSYFRHINSAKPGLYSIFMIFLILLLAFSQLILLSFFITSLMFLYLAYERPLIKSNTQRIIHKPVLNKNF